MDFRSEWPQAHRGSQPRGDRALLAKGLHAVEHEERPQLLAEFLPQDRRSAHRLQPRAFLVELDAARRAGGSRRAQRAPAPRSGKVRPQSGALEETDVKPGHVRDPAAFCCVRPDPGERRAVSRVVARERVQFPEQPRLVAGTVGRHLEQLGHAAKALLLKVIEGAGSNQRPVRPRAGVAQNGVPVRGEQRHGSVVRLLLEERASGREDPSGSRPAAANRCPARSESRRFKAMTGQRKVEHSAHDPTRSPFARREAGLPGCARFRARARRSSRPEGGRRRRSLRTSAHPGRSELQHSLDQFRDFRAKLVVGQRRKESLQAVGPGIAARVADQSRGRDSASSGQRTRKSGRYCAPQRIILRAPS